MSDNNKFNPDEMDFGDDIKPNASSKKWPDNPFDKAFEPSTTPSAQPTITNQKIENDRKQGKSLQKIILVLLLSIGVLIAAVLAGLNKKDQVNSNSVALNPSSNTPVQAPVASSPKPAQVVLPASKPVSSTSAKSKFLVSPEKYCKVSQAPVFITAAVTGLDSVIETLESKIKVATSNKDLSEDKVEFFRSKLEDVSRAEEDIRKFALPHMEPDLSVSYRPINNPCNIKDGKKYLFNWMEDLKTRIDLMNGDLDSSKNQNFDKTVEPVIDNQPVDAGILGGASNSPVPVVTPPPAKVAVVQPKPKPVAVLKPKAQPAKPKEPVKAETKKNVSINSAKVITKPLVKRQVVAAPKAIHQAIPLKVNVQNQNSTSINSNIPIAVSPPAASREQKISELRRQITKNKTVTSPQPPVKRQPAPVDYYYEYDCPDCYADEYYDCR